MKIIYEISLNLGKIFEKNYWTGNIQDQISFYYKLID